MNRRSQGHEPHFFSAESSLEIRVSFVCIFLLTLLCGCASRTYIGDPGSVNLATGPVFIAPFVNGTTDDNAARTMADLVGTALAARGIQIISPEMAALARKTNAPSADSAGDLFSQAKDARATYLLTGTVHEYRYKT